MTSPDAAAAYADKKIDLLATLASFIPSSVVTPFAENLVLSIVLLALLLGFGLRRARARAAGRRASQAFRAVEDGVETLLRVTEVVLGWVIRLIPFAVFGVVAQAGRRARLRAAPGAAVYVARRRGAASRCTSLVTYQAWLLLFARMPLRTFWREAKEPVIYAAGAN